MNISRLKLALGVLILLSLGLIGGYSVTANSLTLKNKEGWLRFHNEGYGYRFDYPADWAGLEHFYMRKSFTDPFDLLRIFPKKYPECFDAKEGCEGWISIVTEEVPNNVSLRDYLIQNYKDIMYVSAPTSEDVPTLLENELLQISSQAGVERLRTEKMGFIQYPEPDSPGLARGLDFDFPNQNVIFKKGNVVVMIMNDSSSSGSDVVFDHIVSSFSFSEE